MDKIAIAVALATVGLWALVVIRMDRASHEAEAISRRLKEVADQQPCAWMGDVARVPMELRPAHKVARGGSSEQGGRAGKGHGRTHDKQEPTL